MKSTIHIAFFLPSLAGGGAEKVFINLAKAFSDFSIEIDFVLGRAEGPFLEELPTGVRVFDLSTNHMAASLFGLSQYLRKNNPDILISGILIANFISVLAKKLVSTQTKTAVCLHSVESKAIKLGAFGKRHVMQIVYPMVIRGADKIIAVSNGVAHDFSMLTGVPLDRVDVIHNPIVDQHLHSMSNEKIIEEWFPKKECPILLSVGRLSVEKDFINLINAFSIVKKRSINAKLIILGEGSERQGLEDLRYRKKLENDVIMPGFVKNPYKFMREADVLIVSSRWESFGNTLVEAMACGCQVIATDCPVGPVELLEAGKWGTIVPVGDPVKLAEAIINNLIGEKKNKVIERAKDFTVQKIARRYLKVLGINI